jgi:hypothetical protein
MREAKDEQETVKCTEERKRLVEQIGEIVDFFDHCAISVSTFAVH